MRFAFVRATTIGCRLIAVAVLAMSLPAVTPSFAADPAPVAASVGEDLDLQTKLPTDPQKSKPKPVDEEETRPSDFRIHLSGRTSEGILWTAIVFGLGFALYALRDTFPSLSRRKKLDPGAVALVPIGPAAVARMEETAVEADDLARGGLFSDAMHMLLLRSLVELRKRLNVTFADSLTSREILHRLELPESGRGALADLIRRVEFAYFGGRATAADDYKACRASYERLTGAMVARESGARAPR